MKLTFKVEDFKPVDSNVLVQPGPIKKIKTLVSTTGDTPRFDPEAKEEPVKLTHEKIPTIMRLGKILGMAANITDADYEVGDWVVYNSRRGFNQKLDLLAKSSDDEKCPIMMQRFEIISKVDIDG